MKKILTSFTLIFFSLLTFAQEGEIPSFWHENLDEIELTPEEKSKYGAVIQEHDVFVLFGETNRKIVRHLLASIITKEGLEDYNKVGVYIDARSTLLDFKARSVSPQGKIKEFNKENIKEVENYEGEGDLKLFAIEGAEVGGMIEYTYTLETPLYDSGKEFISTDYKTRNASITIKAISKFDIAAKAYNTKEVSEEAYNKFKYKFKDVLPISKEGYSATKANRVSVEYKLLGTVYNKSIYANYSTVVKDKKASFFTFTAKELKGAKSLLKSFNGRSDSNEETVRNLATYLKKNFTRVNGYRPDYSELGSILKSKNANEKGLTRLNCLVLNFLKIPYEVHLTCNKYLNLLDKEFPSRYTLDEYLIYLPELDRYIYPSLPFYRFNVVPSWLLGNEALVLSSNFTGTKFVKVAGHDQDVNQTHKVYHVDIDLTSNNTEIITDITESGQRGISLDRNLYYSKTQEEREQVALDEAKHQFEEAEILEAYFLNEKEVGDIATCNDVKCPRSYHVKVNSNSFVEQLGDDMIINVGTILGPQYELYLKDERITPVVTHYKHSYVHEIHIPIPEGYEYKGSQDVEITNLFEREGEKYTGWTSTLKVENNTIVIDIYEFYNKLYYDKSDYLPWRKIVNSAADFTHGTILIKKKL